MCLIVRDIPNRASKTILVKCQKRLFTHDEDNFYTPFQIKKVPNNGILKEKDSRRKYHYLEQVRGRHIHAYTHSNSGFYLAYAINVKAYDDVDDELVCKFLYIPDADKSGNKEKIVAKLKKVLAKKEGMTWADILEIFPGNEEYFQYGQGYNINVKKTRKDKIMSANTNMRNNVVNWTQMVNETNLTKGDLLNFADGNMTRREFERFGGAARKAVRLLGANELRKRARKAASRLPV